MDEATRIAPGEDALTACSREPIHIPGSIQPNGALLVLSEPELEILQVSANCEAFCGWEPSSHPALAEQLRSVVAQGDPALLSPIRLHIGGHPFDASLHRHDGVLIVEIEKPSPETLASLHRRLQKIFAELRDTEWLEEFHERTARFVGELTGFERVMVYKFDSDWHGEVVGEHLSAPVDSYAGHHFPASDIPTQARALYAKSWLRLIPDATYQPVPLEPALNPRTGKPTDLSFAMLRSVSPIHLEYLRNMDVTASMSISIIVEGRLWGLIACHDRQPRILPYAIRAACEIFGQVVSLEIGAKQETLRLAEHVLATKIQTRFFDVLAKEQNIVEALIKYTPDLLNFMSAIGAVIRVGGRTELLGTTPNETQVEEILTWLEGQTVRPLFETDSLREVFPPADLYREKASGLLAVKLSRVEPHYVLWFRPEVVTTRTWAGNPNKPLADDLRIHPRKSFVAWKQTVTGHSLPWQEAERQGGRELVQALNAMVLRRTERLISLNTELEKKNTDLNSFAYIAAHDLKEPLRGIANYCIFMQEDHGEELSQEAIRKVETISALAAQSEELLDALNHFSKIGRMEISRKETDTRELIAAVLTSMESLIKREKATVSQEGNWPTLACDPVLVREVFSNLISNGIRYNNKAEKKLVIGVRDNPERSDQSVFYVQDNGIGIREKHFEDVFRIFRRLHAHEDYGGGTGAGLAIVKSIVEKHDGRIWITSQPDQGTTFNFTLK